MCGGYKKGANPSSFGYRVIVYRLVNTLARRSAGAGEFWRKVKESMIYIIVFIALMALSFLFTSGLVWLVCWAFSFTFTWKLAVGVYAVIALLGGVFKNTSK